jgi:hypothetical protein
MCSGECSAKARSARSTFATAMSAANSVIFFISSLSLIYLLTDGCGCLFTSPLFLGSYESSPACAARVSTTRMLQSWLLYSAGELQRVGSSSIDSRRPGHNEKVRGFEKACTHTPRSGRPGSTAGCGDVDPCRMPCICERLSTPSSEGYARIMLRGSTTPNNRCWYKESLRSSRGAGHGECSEDSIRNTG